MKFHFDITCDSKEVTKSVTFNLEEFFYGTLQILKVVDLATINILRAKHLTSIKKFIHYASRAILWQTVV